MFQDFNANDYRKMTPEEFQERLNSDSKLSKEFNKLKDCERVVMAKAKQLGIHWRHHPKPNCDTYMVSPELCLTQVVNNPYLYPIADAKAPEGYVLKRYACVDQPEVEAGMFYHIYEGEGYESTVVHLTRRYYASVTNPDPSPKREDFADNMAWRQALSRWKRVIDKFVSEDKFIFRFDTDDVIAYWENQFKLKLVRTNKPCKSGYYKLAHTKIVWSPEDMPVEAPKMLSSPSSAPVVDQNAKRRAAALKAWETMRAKGIR